MISTLMDTIAPRARARIEVSLDNGWNEFIAKIKDEHTLLSDNKTKFTFRVKGDFFSDLRATDVLIGKASNSKHYGKIGFFLYADINEHNKVVLKAEERILFGYLEVMAASEALEGMLSVLAKKYDVKQH